MRSSFIVKWGLFPKGFFRNGIHSIIVFSKHFCTLGFFTHIMRENRTALANDSRTFYDLIMPTFRLINWFSFSDIFPEGNTTLSYNGQKAK